MQFIAVGYHAAIVVLSYLIATFASYVALDLAKRARTRDPATALGWWLGGSVAMGTGIWSMHFVGMLAASFPFAMGYGYALTTLSWVAAVMVSAVALYAASRPHLGTARLVGSALVMGGGICSMHYTGMAAMDLSPGVTWDPLLIASSAVIAVATSAVALLIFGWLRAIEGSAKIGWQLLAAVVMGAASSGMHYTGMAAAAFASGTICLSAGQLGGDGLGLLVSVATTALLTLTMFASAIDARLQAKAASLAASLKAANTALQQLAFRDALTGLPNRLLFDDRVQSAVERCDRNGASLAVLFIDLDGFKPLNDSFGHSFGDEVLSAMAHRLSAVARSSDTVARVGGDEFVLLQEGEPDTAAAAQMAQRVVDALSAPLVGATHDARLSCSVGIAMYPANGPRAQLMASADAAMVAAKRAGGSGYAFFEPHMNADVREQLALQQDLREAIAQGSLTLAYQPKTNALHGTITGVEALARWQHPTRGMVSPAVFIALAERFGLIGPLGNWVIEEACRQLRTWLDEGLSIRVAINLSVHQLRQQDLPERIERTLRKYELEARRLTVEITESVAMSDADNTRANFRRLRKAGVKLSIDDFGTGYSSLAYLSQLQANELKIDRSFVQDLESSADARAIVKAVVQLAHALGLTVVAEGVETPAQRDALTRLGCDELQGFLFSPALPPKLLTAWVAEAASAGLAPFEESDGADGLTGLASPRPAPAASSPAG